MKAGAAIGAIAPRMAPAGLAITHWLRRRRAGGFKQLACSGLILGCMGCTAFFPNGPAMVGCFAACLGTFYGYCRDCLDILDVPETGDGDGVGDGSPAGGTCFPNKCCEWGDNGECTLCIPRNAACP